MVEIPDRLECLFSASIEQHGDSYSIEIPQDELEQGTIASDETYGVAVLPSPSPGGTTDTHQRDGSAPSSGAERAQTPPVEKGDVREVTIETIGDQGDGIVKVERGYVVIVPGARPDDEVTIEIEQVRENVAFARVRDDEDTSDAADGEKSFTDGDDTLDESDELP